MSILMYWPCSSEETGDIPIDKLIGILNQKDWICSAYNVVSNQTTLFSLTYRNEIMATFMLGRNRGGVNDFPIEWNSLATCFPSRVFREINTSGRNVFKWNVILSPVNREQNSRDTVSWTYIVGEKSTYTYHGAGLWRIIDSFSGQGALPYIYVKLYIANQKKAERVKETLDSFRKNIVPDIVKIYAGSLSRRRRNGL